MSIGVPIKILHEAEGHVVTIESVTSEVYRGKLIEAEDNMNCQLANVTVTYRDGRQAQLEYIYVRGSKIRFMIFPDMLKVRRDNEKKIGRSSRLLSAFRTRRCSRTCAASKVAQVEANPRFFALKSPVDAAFVVDRL